MELFESLGFAFREQKESDYGIDAHAELIQSELPTGRLLGIQLKSGPSYFSERDKAGFIFRTDEKHINYWLNHALPVLLCLCDVDTRDIYWQAVNKETVVSTGKGYKIIVPSTQLINLLSIELLQNLLTPIVPVNRYTIFEKNDVSHGAAKRCIFAVVINGTVTKPEIAAVVRQVTKDGIKSKYYRDRLIENRHGDSDAKVVWTFIYPTPEDYQHRAFWICRSIWIDNMLDEQFRPIGFQGENIGDNIIVDWNANYHEWSKLFSESTGTKEEYLSTIIPIVNEAEDMFKKIEYLLNRYRANYILEEEFIASTVNDFKRIEELYRESRNLPFVAPFECRDVNQKFQSFVSSLDNIRLHYSNQSLNRRSKENRLWLAVKDCSFAQEKLQHFKYELSKIR